MDNGPHILVVDDNREIRDLLGRFLVKHGFRVTTAADGREMWRKLETARIDLIVLDLMLPGDDGLTLCRNLRAQSNLPVVMLTAMGEETDRIVGLEMGADDYVPKPFSPRELMARIKAVLRRTQAASEPAAPSEGTIYRFADWRFDSGRRELSGLDGVAVPLSTGEFELLFAFVQRPGRVLNRDQLLDLTRGRSAAPFDRSIDTQISRLRRKIEPDQKAPQFVKTVWGEGYVFTPQVTRE